jgi:hypothetical protein
MTVYVDSARNPYGRMLMCHMVADGVEELLGMADRIGLARRHFQNGSFPHFDLSQYYRAKAIGAGAQVVDRRGLVEVMRRYRGRLKEDPDEVERLRIVIAGVTRR